MEGLRVPQRQVEARIQLRDGQEIEGKLFASELGPGGEQGKLVDRLNDPQEAFVPFATSHGPVLVNTDWIVSVRVGIEEDADPGEAPAEETIGAHFRLVGGATVLGAVHVIMPPERSRLLDFLNAGPRFIQVRDQQGIVLVQRHLIVSARPSV